MLVMFSQLKLACLKRKLHLTSKYERYLEIFKNNGAKSAYVDIWRLLVIFGPFWTTLLLVLLFLGLS